MKRQIIFTVEDDSFYTIKLILCALINRIDRNSRDKDVIEVLINSSDILEKRLEIPNLKYTNEQINLGAGVYISFPFKEKLIINGDSVFNINKNSNLNNLMEEICAFLSIKINLSNNSIFKTMLLTTEYLKDIVLRVKENKVLLENAEFFTVSDLVNFATLAYMPTLTLSDLIYTEDSEKIVETIELLESMTQSGIDDLFSGLSWASLGNKLIAFEGIDIPDDIELNSSIFKKISGVNSSKDINILTTAHLINLLTELVLTGINPVYKIPELENPMFTI